MARIVRLERELLIRLNVDVSRYGEAVSVAERVDRVERALGHCLALKLSTAVR
jgi:hypothetical protein